MVVPLQPDFDLLLEHLVRRYRPSKRCRAALFKCSVPQAGSVAVHTAQNLAGDFAVVLFEQQCAQGLSTLATLANSLD